MVEFLVWAVAAPAVGIFYALLVGCGLVIAVALYAWNRSTPHRATNLLGGTLGFLSALGFIAVSAERRFHLPEVIGVVVIAAWGLALLLLRRHVRGQRVTIAPYSTAGTGSDGQHAG